MECSLVEMNTMRTIAHTTVPMPGAYNREIVTKEIIKFTEENEIKKGIKLHLIIDAPVHNSEICDDDMYGFVKYFNLKTGKIITASSTADMLAYRQWNLIGMSFGTKKMRDEWASHSRMALLYISDNNANMSMINNGVIIDGLGLGEYRKYTSEITMNHITGMNMNDTSIQAWSKAMEPMLCMMFETMHADYTYIYLDPHIETQPALDTGMIKTRYVDNVNTTTQQDIIEAVVMIDSYYEGDHYYMRAARGDYQDVTLEIEDDDGTVKSMPVFQH